MWQIARFNQVLFIQFLKIM